MSFFDQIRKKLALQEAETMRLRRKYIRMPKRRKPDLIEILSSGSSSNCEIVHVVHGSKRILKTNKKKQINTMIKKQNDEDDCCMIVEENTRKLEEWTKEGKKSENSKQTTKIELGMIGKTSNAKENNNIKAIQSPKMDIEQLGKTSHSKENNNQPGKTSNAKENHVLSSVRSPKMDLEELGKTSHSKENNNIVANKKMELSQLGKTSNSKENYLKTHIQSSKMDIETSKSKEKSIASHIPFGKKSNSKENKIILERKNSTQNNLMAIESVKICPELVKLSASKNSFHNNESDSMKTDIEISNNGCSKSVKNDVILMNQEKKKEFKVNQPFELIRTQPSLEIKQRKGGKIIQKKRFKFGPPINVLKGKCIGIKELVSKKSKEIWVKSCWKTQQNRGRPEDFVYNLADTLEKVPQHLAVFFKKLFKKEIFNNEI